MDRYGTDGTELTNTSNTANTADAADAAQPAWDGFRLSRQQERILGLIRNGLPDRTVTAIRIAGKIDRMALNYALRDVVIAHESLRTAYRQVLGENSALLMVISEAEKTEIAAFMQTELISHGDEDHTLVLSVTRMNMDTMSAWVLARDLQQAYAARSADQAWQRENIVQYADFAQWQLEQLEQSEQNAQNGQNIRQKALAAERVAQLAELTPLHLPLELNTNDPRCTELRWSAPVALVRQLRQRAQDQQCGLRSILLAGWFAALWHACGRPDRIAVDAMLTRRPFDELMDSIGAFESPMPVFATIAESTLLRDLVCNIDLELDALDQTDEALLAATQQDTRRIPGFSFFDHPSLPGNATLQITGIQADSISNNISGNHNGSSKIGLSAEAYGDTLTFTLWHQECGMAEGGAAALLTCLQAVLTALGKNFAQPVHSLAMLDPAAGLELIARTNPTTPVQTPCLHWHRLVEQTALRAPEEIALRYGERSWTYREFDLAASRLANELIERGVGAGTLTGLHIERSDIAIIAMLAIAKAGSAYVPVDPALPAKRQAQIFAEAQLRHVLTATDTGLPSGIDAIVIDPELQVCAKRSSEAPHIKTSADSPAYVLFTSGSTGVPKGVVIGHGQLAAYLDGVLERLQLTGHGPIHAVALGSLATDLGNTALFPPLISGGELMVIPPDISADAQALAAQLSEARYDLMKITPSHLASIFAVADAPEKVLPRRCLVLGGEPFSWGWFNLFQGFSGGCNIFNHYGPTETTVGVLCGQTTSNALAGLSSTVPLGKPMRNARAYILDPQQRPLPYGVPGELWIGGATVANGYLSQRDGQAERFFADPFAPSPEARMYRSGDRVRHLPDGSIEFLGRIDRQVKVRGFRVELGEIEAVMRQHPRVTASLVIEAGESSATHLVGYLIDAEGNRGNAEWLRPFLAERLPDFMIPTHFVALDRFPLTSAGKIDASMLPEPGALGGAGGTDNGNQAYVEPRTETETRVAAIVAELLLLKRVGANDDFFDIGGHSLLATQLIARLRKTFQIDLKLRSLFERSMVSELAELIDARLAAKASQTNGSPT